MAGDSTEFLIELAAQFSGGQAAVATLSELGDKLLVAGTTSKDFAVFVDKAKAAVTESAEAMKIANDALADGQGKYDELEASAVRASKAVEKVNALVEAQAAKLAEAQKAGNSDAAERAAEKMQALGERQAEAGKKAESAAHAFRESAASLDALKAKAAAADKLHGSLAAGLKNVEAAAKKAKENEDAAAGSGALNELSAGLRKIGGPAASATDSVIAFGEGFKKLVSSLGSAGGYVAIAAGILAIASASIAATIAISKWGVAMADANRTSTLLTAGVARTVAGGEELEATISKLGDVVPQSREELLQMAGGLADAGLRGKDLSKQLEIAAVKAAQLKFGPDFGKQLLSLDVQSRRLHDNIADTFGGLKIEGLLGGVHTLVALFDSSTASGKALKFLFEALFQPLIDGATAAVPKVERLFLYAEILALKAYIALKPYHAQIEEVGKALLVGAGIIAGTFAVALGIVVVLITAAVAAAAALEYGLYRLWSLIIGGVIEGFAALNDEILHVADIGTEIIDGLISGITGGAKKLADSMVGVVTGGVDAVEKALGIASPSKVFYEIGANTSEGYAGGVDEGTDDAQNALENMVNPPKGSGGPAGARSSGPSIVVNITVEGGGKEDQSLAELIAEKVRDVLESDSLMLGGGEVPSMP